MRLVSVLAVAALLALFAGAASAHGLRWGYSGNHMMNYGYDTSRDSNHSPYYGGYMAGYGNGRHMYELNRNSQGYFTPPCLTAYPEDYQGGRQEALPDAENNDR